MLIEAKKLIGLPVAAWDSREKIGQIREILINPENGRILGFLVHAGGFLSDEKALATSDIKEWDTNGLVTETAANLVEPKEIARIKEVMAKKIFLLGMKARTEAGQGLGEVENLLIDSETECVVKYYLRDILGKARVLTPDKVVKIDQEIIFSDDISRPSAGAVAAA